MAIWLVIVIVIGIMLVIFIGILGIICTKFEYRIRTRDSVIKDLLKENNHKQELLNAYGIKEINIGGNE